MIPEILQCPHSSTTYHPKYYVQLYRAFLPNLYLHTDGVWTEDDSSAEGRAYFDTPEQARRYIEDNPYEWVS